MGLKFRMGLPGGAEREESCCSQASPFAYLVGR